MNPSSRTSHTYEQPHNYIREEKLKQAQVYKKKNQHHPAFRK